MAIPLLVAGVGIQAYGAIKSGQDKAAAAESEAASKRAQAQETLAAGIRQESLDRYKEGKIEGEVVAAAGRGGVELSGSPLALLEESHAQMQMEISAQQRATDFRYNQLMTGASFQDKAASDYSEMGYLTAAGDAILGAGKMYSLADPQSSPTVSIEDAVKTPPTHYSGPTALS